MIAGCQRVQNIYIYIYIYIYLALHCLALPCLALPCLAHMCIDIYIYILHIYIYIYVYIHIYIYICPTCTLHKEVAHMKLLREGLWKSFKCPNCKAYKSTRQWHCQCKVQWHSCLLHAGLGHACRPLKRQLQQGVKANSALTLQQPIADSVSFSSDACNLANSVESRSNGVWGT